MWREPDPAAFDARLNPLLSKLRRVLGAEAVEGRSLYGCTCQAPGSTWKPPSTPIHRAESAVAQRDWTRAWGPVLVALFAAERGFLPGEDAPWINEIRNQLDHAAATRPGVLRRH